MKLFALFTIIFILESCSQDSKEIDIKNKNANHESTSNPKEKVIDQKKDSFFVLKNIKDLNFIDNLNWDFDNLYFGKSNIYKFEKLDNDLKLKYLYDFIWGGSAGHKIDKEWFKMDLQAFIVAKQPKINNFQPTLIKVYGTDYSGLFLVNIKNKEVISGYPIYDLETSGPEFSEDTLIITRPKILCTFKKNKLFFKKMTGTCKPTENLIQSFDVKQISYVTTIDFTGKIRTEKKDSCQYQKKCELDYFQTY